MLPLIAFGIIALIIVIFLVTFNVRSLSRTESAKEAHSEKTHNLPSDKPITQIEEGQNNPEPTSSKKDSGKFLMSDEQYRNTVRQFRAQQNVKTSSLPKQSDKEYRSALRSISKPKP